MAHHLAELWQAVTRVEELKCHRSHRSVPQRQSAVSCRQVVARWDSLIACYTAVDHENDVVDGDVVDVRCGLDVASSAICANYRRPWRQDQ